MAKKRSITRSLPASPLAGKLAAEVTRPLEPEPAPPTVPDEAIAASPVSLLTEPAPKPLETPAKPSAAKERPKKRKGGSKLSKTHKEARVMMALDDFDDAEAVVRALRQASGTTVTFSHLTRALLSLAARALPSIEANAPDAEFPDRPANNDLMALAEYEDAIADFLLVALRDRLKMDAE